MRITVVGGSGLVGAKLVSTLRHRGHDVIAASRRSGVNTLTGVGLAEAVEGSRVVVDVTNSSSFEDAPAIEFFHDPPLDAVLRLSAAHPRAGRRCDARARRASLRSADRCG